MSPSQIVLKEITEVLAKHKATICAGADAADDSGLYSWLEIEVGQERMTLHDPELSENQVNYFNKYGGINIAPR